MSAVLFRKFALDLPTVQESSHFGKADFRVGNKIFAGFNAENMAYVKLKPEQQEMLCSAEPLLASPIPGGWGNKGWTRIDHNNADEALLKSALLMAWKNIAPKRLQK